MQELYKKIKHVNITDVLKIELSDEQFKALKKMHKNIENKKAYLSLIVANSIICYQLSDTWENYWKEFGEHWEKAKLEKVWDIINFFIDFLPKSKWNKRFIDTKINRINRLKPFFKAFVWKEKYYYENMCELRDLLSKTMSQKKHEKTIVFAVKMFSYWARNYFWRTIEFPNEISIPIDSRLEKLFKKYKWDYKDINKFYEDLSKKTKIAPLHLDSIIWVNFHKLI